MSRGADLAPNAVHLVRGLIPEKSGASLANTAIGEAIKQHPVFGLDDTWIRTLDPGAGKTHQSRLWGYYADDEFYCDYRRSRAGKWPAEFLAGYRGTIMADAYSGHHQLFADGQITPAGAHARRKFEEALAAGELLASQALDPFSLLYRIEADIPRHAIEQRLGRRQAAVPILDRLEALIIGWEAGQRHSSGLYRAAHYTRKFSRTCAPIPKTAESRSTTTTWSDCGASPVSIEKIRFL